MYVRENVSHSFAFESISDSASLCLFGLTDEKPFSLTYICIRCTCMMPNFTIGSHFNLQRISQSHFETYRSKNFQSAYRAGRAWKGINLYR